MCYVYKNVFKSFVYDLRMVTKTKVEINDARNSISESKSNEAQSSKQWQSKGPATRGK